MTVSAINHILFRIKTATKESPIAVFAIPKKDRALLNAVFGATVTTLQLIKTNDPLFIGCFHENIDLLPVRAKLTAAARLLTE